MCSGCCSIQRSGKSDSNSDSGITAGMCKRRGERYRKVAKTINDLIML